MPGYRNTVDRVVGFVMPRGSRTFVSLGLVSAIASILFFSALAHSSEEIQVRVDRWLEVRQATGQVTIQPQSGDPQRANVGSRLQFVGDTLLTGTDSEAILAVDTDVGFVDVAENTSIAIQELRAVSDGGRVTKLVVSRGQARLRVRPFTHGSSELEIQTPAGWSAVRGTSFGVAVQPDGKTGLATLEGAVVTEGQGTLVGVSAGFQTLIVPGEAPLPPAPLNDDTQLNLRLLTALSNETAQVVGYIDPVNLLVVNNEVQSVNEDGLFDLRILIPENRRIRARVITPLGSQQSYDLAIP